MMILRRCAASTYGVIAGATFNLHMPGLGFFIRTGHIFFFGSLNRDRLPLEKGASDVQCGLGIPSGSSFK